VDDKTAEVAVVLFDHLEDQINRTDTKAQAVLGADAILLGWFTMQYPPGVQALFAEHAAMAVGASALLIVLVFVGLFLSLSSGHMTTMPLERGVSAVNAGIFWGIEPYIVAAFPHSRGQKRYRRP
jgi:hypothetical protein